MRLQYALLAAIPAILSAQQKTAPAVQYPDGYRGWRHVSSMVIEPGHPLHEAFGGLHHLYANQAAVQGYLKGKFPDGAVIVFDLLESRKEGGAITAGARKVVGVMVRNRTRYAATGGWGFEAFKGDTRERVVGANAATACYACHAGQQANDYVFSKLP